MTCEPDGPGGGSMEDLGTPPDLLAERFGNPEKERFGEPHSEPWPSDQKGPTSWWHDEMERRQQQQRRTTLAEETSDGGIHGNHSGHDDPCPGDRG